MHALTWRCRAVDQGRKGLTRERIKPVAVWDDDRGRHGPSGIGRNGSRRSYVKSGAAARGQHAGPAQILPVIDVEDKDTHPRPAIVRLLPDTLVYEFALIAHDTIDVAARPIGLDGLNEERMLNEQRRENWPAVDDARLGKGCYQRPPDADTRLPVENRMEAADPAPYGAINVEVDDRAEIAVPRIGEP